MPKTFNIGNLVEAIDDDITGKVIKIESSIITIEDSFGFEFEFEAHELIQLNASKHIEASVNNTNLKDIKKEKATVKRKKNEVPKTKERHAPKFIVDLHIHQLTDSTKGMTNFDMLNLQIDTARRQLEFAIKKRIPKLVFIHGVGEGVLRQELETLLSRYNNISFYDADYKTYGFGATEVKIFQNATRD